MSDVYPFEKKHWYPHMSPEDAAVWGRFIEAYPASYETCQYDVVVGSVPQFVKDDPNVDQASMERLYRKRIDVVAKMSNDIYIIELKPQCTTASIGQVKGYLYLYDRDVKPTETLHPTIICGGAQEDVVEFARNEGVDVVVI